MEKYEIYYKCQKKIISQQASIIINIMMFRFRREMSSLILRVKLYLNLKVCTDILIIHIDYYRFTFQSF